MDSAKAVITDSRKDIEPRKYRFEPLYSGGAAFIDDFDAPVYIDLATLKVDPAPKALLEHDMEQIVGHLENIEITNAGVTCDVIVQGTTAAEKVIDWADNVAEWAPSIGVYRFTPADVTFIAEGETAEINGREIEGAAYIVHNGYLCEGSFVTIGGDGDARAIKAKLFKIKARKMDEQEKIVDVTDEIESKVDEIAIEAAEETDAALDEERDAIIDDVVSEKVDEELNALDVSDAEITPEEVDAIKEEIKEEVQALDDAADRETIDELEKAAARLARAKIRAKRAVKARKTRRVAPVDTAAGRKEARRIAALNALACDDAARAGIVASAIEKGWSVDKTKRVLKATAARQHQIDGLPMISRGGGTAAPRLQDIYAASLARTLGMSPRRIQSAFKFDQRVVDAAEDKKYRNATLRTIVAASNNSFKPGSFGVNTNMMEAWGDCRANCRRASLGGMRATASAGFSTISATDIFSAVMQAFLEPSEEVATRRWTEVARVNTLVDFNSVDSYLPTLQGRLREISATGGIQNISFTTEKFTRAAKAQGINFTIPEMMIINDQIDAFAELLRQFESLGDDCIEHDVAEAFWKVFDGDATDAAGNALVSAARGNYISGGSLSEDGLNAALTALAAFSTANGAPLAVDRAKLLCGNALGATAMKLFVQEYPDFANGTVTPNIYRGRFEPVVWSYLDAAHARQVKDDGTTPSLLAGGKTWAMIRDPQTRPVVCVNKLVGFESPQIRQFDYDPSVWGLTYQLIYPYSVSTQYADGIAVITNA